MDLFSLPFPDLPIATPIEPVHMCILPHFTKIRPNPYFFFLTIPKQIRHTTPNDYERT